MFPDVKFLWLTLYEWCLLIGVLAALVVTRVYADRLKIKAKLQNFGILCAVLAILGGYGCAVLFQAVYDLIAQGVYHFDVSTGATFYGGLIGGVCIFTLIWFTLVRKICGKEAVEVFPKILGIGGCAIAIAHSIGRIGCLMAGCCHGGVTDGPFGIPMCTGYGADGPIYEKVVPTQLFESIFLFELYLLLTWMLFRTRVNAFFVYMLLYGLFRFVIEFVRTDDRGALVPGLTPSQFWSVLLFVGGAVLLAVNLFRMRRRN